MELSPKKNKNLEDHKLYTNYLKNKKKIQIRVNKL